MTHGAEHARRTLETALFARSEAWGQTFPELHAGVTVHRSSKRSGWYDLDAGKWMAESTSRDSTPERLAAIEQRLATIEALLRRIDERLS